MHSLLRLATHIMGTGSFCRLCALTSAGDFPPDSPYRITSITANRRVLAQRMLGYLRRWETSGASPGRSFPKEFMPAVQNLWSSSRVVALAPDQARSPDV